MQNKSMVAGILSIVSGVFGVLGLGYMLFMIYFMQAMFQMPFDDFGSGPPIEFFQMFSYLYLGIGIVLAILGIVGIVGGIFAIKKRRWPLALAGAIAGVITFFPTGIAAVILVTTGKDEFELQALYSTSHQT